MTVYDKIAECNKEIFSLKSKRTSLYKEYLKEITIKEFSKQVESGLVRLNLLLIYQEYDYGNDIMNDLSSRVWEYEIFPSVCQIFTSKGYSLNIIEKTHIGAIIKTTKT